MIQKIRDAISSARDYVNVAMAVGMLAGCKGVSSSGYGQVDDLKKIGLEKGEVIADKYNRRPEEYRGDKAVESLNRRLDKALKKMDCSPSCIDLQVNQTGLNDTYRVEDVSGECECPREYDSLILALRDMKPKKAAKVLKQIPLN